MFLLAKTKVILFKFFFIGCMLASVNIFSFEYNYTSNARLSFRTAIFCLHDIDGKGKYSISKKKFIQILDFLQPQFQVVSLKTWYEHVQRNQPFERFPVVLTFDDGYPSVRKIIHPLLKKYNMGATFYIYLNRYSNHSIFYKELSKFEPQFEIGSHSFTHDNLIDTYNKDPRQFFREIYLTKKKLEYLVQKPIISFAWPYGAYNETLSHLLRKAGYDLQVSVAYKRTDKNDIKKEIPRYTLTRKKPLETIKRILKKAVSSD